ncbi:NAD(P)/FAD-dependent oxidoreductase [Streptomyces sp. NPDC056721]|uniref:NAD(P)/FAD-dependent oxidoreductase n=1 Tax=unclassified Streptomyces TaxID=2593676 RepID=UPI0036B3DE32
MTPSRVVVVGASAAGLTAAETLRREGFSGQLTLIGEEPHLPYDRPPLSKQVLKGEWDPERVALRPRQVLDALGAEWLLGRKAVGLDVAGRTVELAGGAEVPFDGLVVATGVRPRRLPFGEGLGGVHVLRDLDDALALREALRSAPTVVVVGAGFLGAEAAAVARQLGCSVSLVDPLRLPMVRQLGNAVAERVARLHLAHGVDLRCSTGVVGFAEEHGRVTGVRLDDGSEIPAQVVLVAIGSVPAVGWLRDSGLPIGDGLLCDAYCEAAPGIVGAGDVASWVHPGLGRLRIEHRMNAAEQGMAAARTLLGLRAPFAPVPYFWTDQFDVKVQAYGRPSGEAEFSVVAGDLGEDRFAGLYGRGGLTTGAVTWNMPREARTLRAEVEARTPWPARTPVTSQLTPRHSTSPTEEQRDRS